MVVGRGVDVTDHGGEKSEKQKCAIVQETFHTKSDACGLVRLAPIPALKPQPLAGRKSDDWASVWRSDCVAMLV